MILCWGLLSLGLVLSGLLVLECFRVLDVQRGDSCDVVSYGGEAGVSSMHRVCECRGIVVSPSVASIVSNNLSPITSSATCGSKMSKLGKMVVGMDTAG